MASQPTRGNVRPTGSAPSNPTPVTNKGVGLGDLVSRVTKTLGFRECGGCRRRRALLNKIRFGK